MKTFKKRKQTRKQKRKQKGGMWFTQNIDKSCEDNLKDFNRTRYRRPPNEPYNPTTYYPGLFNVHSKPVQQSMNCTNSDTPIPQTKFSNECREVNRFLVSNYKQKRSEEFLLYGFYCCFNPTTCEDCRYPANFIITPLPRKTNRQFFSVKCRVFSKKCVSVIILTRLSAYNWGA